MDKEQTEKIKFVGRQIQKVIAGEVKTDFTSRLLYSTDASIYQVEPLGVIFPKTQDDLQAIVETCAEFKMPIIARGSGSGLGGQAIGPGWIIDCTRWLNRLVELDPVEKTATVEPGLILNALNQAARPHGLQFGPDPASAERASMGGSIANNAAGAHSICYGMAVDHLLEADVVLSDGSLAAFNQISLDHSETISRMDNREGLLYRAALHIRSEYGDAIRKGWPLTWRRASGYNVNYLLPWTPSAPPQWGRYQDEIPYPPVQQGSINLAPLFAGSEGTLGVLRRMKIRLVQRPAHTILVALKFPGIVEACEAVPEVLRHDPAAVELIPQNLIQLAASVPAYASQVAVLRSLFEDGKAPPALLVVEFNGEDEAELRQKAVRLAANMPHIIAYNPKSQQMIWGVRKAGLGLFMSRPGAAKPWSFIEDLSVPVERLGEFVREMYRIMLDYGVEGENYGHASAGCLHIRPVINLKTVQGVEMLRKLATEAVDLTLRLGGSVSGEHGDGLVRSEWGERMFGSEILRAFRLLKHSADPENLLNPGKIISPDQSPPPKMDANLRFGPDYQSKGWDPVFDFSSQTGMEGAIEQCNGAGVCRKQEGVMCPSFQVTNDEMFSTRGRANLLRASITGTYSNHIELEEAVKKALDLCLACKGCKAECPSAVDMAKLKYEFFEHYYQSHPRPWRDYLFGYIDLVGKLSQPFWFIANLILGSSGFSALAERGLGISRQRQLPKLAKRKMRSSWRVKYDIENAHSHYGDDILFLSDPFTEYFYPQAGLAALEVLSRAGCHVRMIPVIGTGRTLISKGFVSAAKRHARKLVAEIERLDPGGKFPIIGVEPSEIASLYDEYRDLSCSPDGIVQRIVERSFTIEEYLVRHPDKLQKAKMRIAINDNMNTTYSSDSIKSNKEKLRVLLHGHCYQKARPPAEDGLAVGVEASRQLLEAAGYQVRMAESGCCGMAGAFGYEKEHVEVSQRVGELSLFPAVRTADHDELIAASGISCRSQVLDGTGRAAFHPIELLLRG